MHNSEEINAHFVYISDIYIVLSSATSAARPGCWRLLCSDQWHLVGIAYKQNMKLHTTKRKYTNESYFFWLLIWSSATSGPILMMRLFFFVKIVMKYECRGFVMVAWCLGCSCFKQFHLRKPHITYCGVCNIVMKRLSFGSVGKESIYLCNVCQLSDKARLQRRHYFSRQMQTSAVYESRIYSNTEYCLHTNSLELHFTEHT